MSASAVQSTHEPASARVLTAYNSRYDGAAYLEIEHQALLVTKPEAIWDLGGTSIPTDVTEFMNTVIDAAMELCGCPYYYGAAVRVSLMAYSYGDKVLDATDEFLKAFVKA